jgi:hypothetical protein
MRKIRQVLEYRLSKGLSADQTAQALSLSKGSVINYLERFKEAKLRWPLPEALTDTQLEAGILPVNGVLIFQRGRPILFLRGLPVDRKQIVDIAGFSAG